MLTAISAAVGLLILVGSTSAVSAQTTSRDPFGAMFHAEPGVDPASPPGQWPQGRTQAIAEASVKQGEIALARGHSLDLAAAHDSARGCLQAAPHSSRCHALLGDVLAARMQAEGAWSVLWNARQMLSSYETALRYDPGNYRVRLALFRCYLDLPFLMGANERRAAELAAEVRRVEPDLARLMRAMLAMHEGRPANAEQEILAARLDRHPLARRHEHDLLAGLADAYFQAGHLDASRRLYAQLQQRIPDSEAGWVGQALVAREQRHWLQAAAYLEQAARITPRAQVFMLLGEQYAALADRSRAMRAYQSALASKPALADSEQARVRAALESLLAQ